MRIIEKLAMSLDYELDDRLLFLHLLHFFPFNDHDNDDNNNTIVIESQTRLFLHACLFVYQFIAIFSPFSLSTYDYI